MNSILVKFPEESLSPAAVAALLRLRETDVRVYHAVDHAETYVWLASHVEGVALRASHPLAHVVDLALTTDVAGHCAGQVAPWRYMVETDVKPDAQRDFDSWYETEHLPGLAAVPGTVAARRYVARDGAPRYYACYDLAQREAFGSPAWLAVRATPWSDRVRPNFINTKRTMFRLVQDATEV